MTLNSIPFLLFFVIVFAVYYLPFLRRRVRLQNLWLLLASYFFYALISWKMAGLLIGATGIFFFIGKWVRAALDRERFRRASAVTAAGVVLGVGILFYFKYFGFFAEQLAALLSSLGLHAGWSTLNIIVPVGVSFFTFKLISYVIEIHREKLPPTTDFIEFGVYIAFFPTILSGPIDRANTFIPQLRKEKEFDRSLAEDGCRQILWGLFMKMCVADYLAPVIDSAWTHTDTYHASSLFVCALLYPIQLYADFDGYSNMAIGLGKLLGLRVQKNFNHPFLARNLAEYWRQWHISLTSWLTDYVFYPLNLKLRDMGKAGVSISIVVTMVLVGFWHGPSWTYGIFGLYHGLLLVVLVYSGTFMKRRKLKAGRLGLPRPGDLCMMVVTFGFVAIGLIIFRAPSVGELGHYISGMCHLSACNVGLALRELWGQELYFYNLQNLLLIPAVFVIEWFTRNNEFGLQVKAGSALARRPVVRFAIYYVLVFAIILLGGESSRFVYFQF